MTVVKLSHSTAADDIAELEESALAFWNCHRKQTLALLTQFTTFGHITQTMEVGVGTRQYCRQLLALQLVLLSKLLQTCQSKRTRRFGNRTSIFKDVFYCRADLIARNGNMAIDVLLT